MEGVEEKTIAVWETTWIAYVCCEIGTKGSCGTVTMKKRWILLLQLLVLLVCIAGLFGKDKTWNMEGAEFSGLQQEDGRFVFSSETVSLSPGVYRARLSYETQDDMINAWNVEAEGLSFDGLLSNACMLYSGLTETDMYFWLLEKTDSLQVKVLCDASSEVAIQGARVEETNLGARAFLVSFLTIFIVWDILLYRTERRKTRYETGNILWEKEIEQRGIVFGMALLILVSSVPLLTGYEIASADLNFHLQRVEGIKDGILAGQFPVRIHPNWLQGYGYATGIFYCDTFLYIPAFLRIMGFPLGAAYLIYKFLVNVGTVVIACESFGRIFKNRLIGLFAAALYTLNIYRLAIMYLKEHLGQYTAAMFLPLFAYGVWRLLSEETESKEYKRVWIILALAATGIVQSHVLTCEMAAVFSLVTGIIFIRRVLRKGTLLEIAKAAVCIVLLNLWFIVPFLDYMMTQELIITGEQVYTREIQDRGSLIPQVFSVFALSGSADLDAASGMQGEIPFSLGAGLLISLFYYGYLCLTGSVRRQKKGEIKSLGIFSAVLSVFTLFMASAYFPWNRLQSLGTFMAKGISALQYPTRNYMAAAVFLSLLGGCVLRMEEEGGRKRRLWLYAAGTLITLFFVVGIFLNGLLSTAYFYKIYEENSFGNSYLSGREYLPAGTDESLLKAGRVVTSEGVSYRDLKKDYAGTELYCENGSAADGYVELPLLYYRGYQAEDVETGELFAVSDGANHVVRVEVPKGYQGIVYTSFVSPFYWRAAEVVTLMSWCGFLIYCVRGYMQNGRMRWSREKAAKRR